MQNSTNHKLLLTNEIPDTEELDLSYTPFITDNPGFFKLSLLPSLTVLDLSQCTLRNIDPVCDLIKLTRLNVSYNAIRLLPARPRLARLERLEFIDLRGNRIDATGELKKLDIFANLREILTEGNPVMEPKSSALRQLLTEIESPNSTALFEEIRPSPVMHSAFERHSLSISDDGLALSPTEVQMRLERLQREHVKTRHAITELERKLEIIQGKRAHYVAFLREAQTAKLPTVSRRLVQLLLRREQEPRGANESLHVEVAKLEPQVLAQSKDFFTQMNELREGAIDSGEIQNKIDALRIRENRILEKITLANVLLNESRNSATLARSRPQLCRNGLSPRERLKTYETHLREHFRGERPGILDLALYQHRLIMALGNGERLVEDRDELIELLKGFVDEQRPPSHTPLAPTTTGMQRQEMPNPTAPSVPRPRPQAQPEPRPRTRPRPAHSEPHFDKYSEYRSDSRN
jgi:hypothetical protein